MKKLNIIALLSFMLIGQSVQATDMFIKMEIFPNRKQKIYNEIVSYSGLAKSPHDAEKDNYHLTLAQIKGAKGNKNLKKFLLEELNKACQGTLNDDHAIILKDVYADRYTVNRSHSNCPIALFPHPDTCNTLKMYNQILNGALAQFNTNNGTNYQMGDDLVSLNHTPHITLANTDWINKKCKYSCDEIITTLNKKIIAAKQKNNKPTYDFMLKVPQ